MSSYRPSPSRSDRAKAIAAVAAVHLALAALVISGQQLGQNRAKAVRTTLIDIAEPPPPPPPEPVPRRAKEEEGEAGKMAEPTPIVAPQPRIVIPANPPLAAAPAPGSGSSSIAGAAAAGGGPGAGGSGAGRGGGGTGGGLVSGPRLVSGGPKRSDYRRLGARIAGPTRALIRLGIDASGHVEDCAVVASTGYAEIDQRICPLLAPRMRWSPAIGGDGQPKSSWLHYVMTFDRN